MKKLILALSISSAISGYATADATAAADLTFEVGSPIQSQIDCNTDLVPGDRLSAADCNVDTWAEAAFNAENLDVAAAAAQVTAEAALTAATTAQAALTTKATEAEVAAAALAVTNATATVATATAAATAAADFNATYTGTIAELGRGIAVGINNLAASQVALTASKLQMNLP